MATPTISNAVLVGSTLTVTGSNFGSKSTPGFLFKQRFNSTSNGDTKQDCGYADIPGLAGSPEAEVDMTDGVLSGCGCLRYDTGPGDAEFESFPHIMYGEPDATFEADEVYHSFYFKIVQATGSGGAATSQIKGCRSGSGLGYNDNPKITYSIYMYRDVATDGYYSFNSNYRPTSGVDTFLGEDVSSGTMNAFNKTGWNFLEVWQKYNDVGDTNGFQRIWINGHQASINSESLEARTLITEFINFVYLFPGIDLPYGGTNEYTIKFADHIIDITPQRVAIGDASTKSACTKFHFCEASSWATGTAVANTFNLPAWATHVYIFNENKEFNATGFEIGGGSPATPQLLTMANNVGGF